MAYPVLFHDDSLDEPACIGCMACVNYCPTECISATVSRNPLHQAGGSSRKTVASSFEVDLSNCIECGICVDMCDFEAIALGLDAPPPGVAVVDMRWLEDQGRKYVGRVGHEKTITKPNVRRLLEAVRDRLPPASSSDGARRAWSRLRTSKPVDVRVDRRSE